MAAFGSAFFFFFFSAKKKKIKIIVDGKKPGVPPKQKAVF